MNRRMSLSTFVFLGGAILMMIPALVAGTIYTGALQQEAERIFVEKLTTRGELSANVLARRLNQLWREIARLSKTTDLSNMDRIRQEINFVGQLDNRYSWIGVTDVNGRVLAATQGMLEGQVVSERPWFRRGLQGPAAIDIHEALLLSRMLTPSAEPYRFVDFAAPIKNADGAVAGVIGAHLDWRWVVDNIASLKTPGTDLILLSRDRTVLAGPPDLVDKRLDISSAQAAGRVTTSVLDERWPDGKNYVTVVVPTIGFSDLPSFGWSLLVRQDVDVALGPTRTLVRSFWVILGTGAIVALILLFMGAQWVAVPLRRLAVSAEAMGDGGAQKPVYAETRYEEAARLSDALTHVQSKLLSAKKPERTQSMSSTASPPP